jgi:hypothetical protein
LNGANFAQQWREGDIVRRLDFAAMGSTVHLRYSGDREANELEPAIEAIFRKYGQRFHVESLREEFRRIATGEMALSTASVELRDAVNRATAWRRRETVSTLEYPLASGDLLGTISAMSLDSAGALLDAAGIANWSLRLGGSVLVRGTNERDTAWECCIAHPHHPSSTMVIALDQNRRAIHTRRSPNSRAAAPAFEQVTVMGDDILAVEFAVSDLFAHGPDRFWVQTDELGVSAIALETNGLVHASASALEAVTSTGLAWSASLAR